MSNAYDEKHFLGATGVPFIVGLERNFQHREKILWDMAQGRLVNIHNPWKNRVLWGFRAIAIEKGLFEDLLFKVDWVGKVVPIDPEWAEIGRAHV